MMLVSFCGRALFLLVVLATFVLAAQDYYKELGVDREADDRTIKKAYKKLARKFHPDKSSDPAHAERFTSISHAYEILMDAEKRKIYDRYGEAGLKQQQQGGGGFHDPRDMFSRFFGGGGGQPEEQRGPSKLTEIEVDLADFYNGRDLEFEMDKNILCDHCRGSGAASDSDVVKCGGCGGQGVKLTRHQVFPGMFTQMQSTCNDCGGTGTQIRRPCPHCKANKIVPSRISLSIHLPPGAPENFEVVFDGDSDESPDWEAGDVIVRVKSKRVDGSGGWSRKERSLVQRVEIGVEEALLGFSKTIKHLDGRSVDISRKGVTQPGYVQVIDDEGMPAYNENEVGDLFVHYTVVFPTTVSPSLRQDLESAFEKTRGGKKRDEL